MAQNTAVDSLSIYSDQWRVDLQRDEPGAEHEGGLVVVGGGGALRRAEVEQRGEHAAAAARVQPVDAGGQARAPVLDGLRRHRGQTCTVVFALAHTNKLMQRRSCRSVTNGISLAAFIYNLLVKSTFDGCHRRIKKA